MTSYYQEVSQLPSQGNASGCRCGNAQQNYLVNERPQYPISKNTSIEGFNSENLKNNKKYSWVGNKMASNGMSMKQMSAGSAAYPSGMAGGQVAASQCAFPSPAPRRTYCQPAAFVSRGCGGGAGGGYSSGGGMVSGGYFTLNDAYGHSRTYNGY